VAREGESKGNPMPDTTSAPSVTKLFSRDVKPQLLELGFTADGAKRYRRVVDGILQCVFLHVETRIYREF